MFYAININTAKKQYTIVESATEQTRDSNAETTRKVYQVLGQGYTYSPTSTDKFTPLSNEERRTILLEIPSIIRDNEYNKTVAIASRFLPRFIVDSLFPPVTNTSVNRVAERRADRILQKALKSPTIRKLYDAACATGKWNVEFVSKPRGGFKASFEWDNRGTGRRCIQLANYLTDDQALSFLIFELTNAYQLPKFVEVHKRASQGEIDADEFAKIYEKIEFDGTRLHHELVSKARSVDGMDWNDDVDRYQSSTDNWDIYWAHQKDTPHAQSYRDEFERQYGHIRAKKSVELDTPFLDPDL